MLVLAIFSHHSSKKNMKYHVFFHKYIIMSRVYHCVSANIYIYTHTCYYMFMYHHVSWCPIVSLKMFIWNDWKELTSRLRYISAPHMFPLSIGEISCLSNILTCRGRFEKGQGRCRKARKAVLPVRSRWLWILNTTYNPYVYYIYIRIERERDLEILYVCIFTYINIHMMYVYNYVLYYIIIYIYIVYPQIRNPFTKWQCKGMAKVVPGRPYIMKKPQRLRNNTLKTDLGVGYTPKWQRIMHIYIYVHIHVYGCFHKWGTSKIDGWFHGKSHWDGRFGGTSISGNLHITYYMRKPMINFDFFQSDFAQNT